MRSVSRISARLLLSVAAAMLATTRMASPAVAGADRGPAVNRAYQHLLRMEGDDYERTERVILADLKKVRKRCP